MTRSALLALLVGLVIGCDDPRPRGEPVRVGLAVPSYVHAVAWIADDRGLFAHRSVDVRIDVMGGSAAAVRAMLADQSDVGILGGDAVVRADLAGADLVIVAGLVNRFYHRIIGRHELRTIEDLRGKRVGLPFLGGPQDMAVRWALTEAGLRYDRDVEVLALGSELNRMAALSRGDIDATASQAPPSQVAALGFSVLADLPAREQPFPYAVVVVRRGYLAAHRAEVRALIDALCEGIRFYRDEEEASLAIVERHVTGGDVRGASEERYATSGPSLLSLPPVPRREGLDLVIGSLGPEHRGRITAADVIDASLVDELVREGRCR